MCRLLQNKDLLLSEGGGGVISTVDQIKPYDRRVSQSHLVPHSSTEEKQFVRSVDASIAAWLNVCNESE